MKKIIYVFCILFYIASVYFTFDYGKTTATKNVEKDANKSLVESAEWVFKINQRLTENLANVQLQKNAIEKENIYWQEEVRNAKKNNPIFSQWSDTQLPVDVNGLLNYRH